MQTTCCGRYKYRYLLEQDSDGQYYCDHCWSVVPQYPPAVAQSAPEAQSVPEATVPQEAAAVPSADVAAGEPPPKAVLMPRDDSVAEPPAKVRRNTQSGTIDYWNHYKGYGYALFDGERAIFHAKGCVDLEPSACDAVTAYVHRRRRDGKSQAFKLCRVAETMDQRPTRVHNTLLGAS